MPQLTNSKSLSLIAMQWLPVCYMLVVLLFCGCAERQDLNKKKDDITSTEDGKKASEVSYVSTVTVRNFAESDARQSVLNGTVIAKIRTPLSFRVSGQVAHVYVREGDKVQKGQLLAVLDTTIAQLGQKGLRQKIAQQHVHLDHIQSELRKMEPLVASGAMARFEYDQLVTDRDALILGISQIENEQNVQQQQVEQSRLYAPHQGIVATQHIEVGQVFTLGQPAYVITDDRTLELQVDVPSYMVNNLSDWQAFVVTLVNDNTMRVPLKLQRIATAAHPMSSNFSVVYTFATQALPLREGEVVPVELVQKKAPVVDAGQWVPASSVEQTGSSDAYVWELTLIKPSHYRVHKKMVRVLSYRDSLVKVAGANVGSRIVVAGIGKLQEGQLVQAIPDDVLMTDSLESQDVGH